LIGSPFSFWVWCDLDCSPWLIAAWVYTTLENRTLVQQRSLLAVPKLFQHASVSTASSKGQWKSRTSQASSREPLLQMIYTGCFLKKTATTNDLYWLFP
jgi:hypothetical protein